MQVFSAPGEIDSTIRSLKSGNNSIGLVPTMGALHEGHFSLISRSLKENDKTVVSIFVNPIQFDKQEDLDNYPRDIEKDLSLVENLGVDMVFRPNEEDLYPTSPLVSINFGQMSSVLEGKYRQGHFEGVGVIVAKLLNILKPDSAYFGLKDLQQYLLIKRMCFDLNFQTKIVGVETIREKNGLAMSSRNRRLSREGVEVASTLFRGLKIIQAGIEKGLPLAELISDAREQYSNSGSIQLEYLEAVDASTLELLNSYENVKELAVCVAGYVEGIRLIDNLYLRLK